MSKRFAYETEQDIFASRLYALMQGPPKTTQDELAAFVGVTRQSIALYTSGQSKPNTLQIVKIAQYFGVTTDWLLGVTDNRDPQNRDIGDLLGLSDESIELLHKLSHSDNAKMRRIGLDFINRFLSIDGAFSCLQSVEAMCDTSELNSKFILNSIMDLLKGSRMKAENGLGYVTLSPQSAAQHYIADINKYFGQIMEQFCRDYYVKNGPSFLPEQFLRSSQSIQRLYLLAFKADALKLCDESGISKELLFESLNSMIETGTDPNGIFAAKKGEPLFKKWMSKIVEEVKSGRTIEI